MSIEAAVQRIWDEDRTRSGLTALRAVLRLLSIPYRNVVVARNHLYDRGLLRQEKLPCPVISVGNLTVGGTGKTPTVIHLAHLLRNRGYRPAVLSRGYGGRANAAVNVVSDGNRMLMEWQEAGDEPVLIARSTPGVAVLTGSRRRLTGRAAVERFGADVLILDDAFQHRALYRDIDIVLTDASRPFGNGFLLPRGALREPSAGLRRAHLLIRTGGGTEEAPPVCENPALPLFRGNHRPQAVVAGGTERMSPVEELQGQRVFAFAGIGRQEAFRKSLRETGAQIVAYRAFPDHHPYRPSDIDALRRLARQTKTGCIITTEKDGIRLADFPDFLAEVSLLRIGMEITPAATFTELIFSAMAY